MNMDQNGFSTDKETGVRNSMATMRTQKYFNVSQLPSRGSSSSSSSSSSSNSSSNSSSSNSSSNWYLRELSKAN